MAEIGGLWRGDEVSRRRVIVWAVAAIAVVVVGWEVFREREPEYQGKTLSEWMEVDRRASSGGGPVAIEEAENAVQQIGTNALPLLLKWIAYEQPEWRVRIYNASHGLPRWFKGREAIISLAEDPKEGRAHMSEHTFFLLGPGATNAIPQLDAMMRRTSATNVSKRAIALLAGLACLGKEALPCLLEALSDTNFVGRGFIAWQISELAAFGVDVSPAIPVLVGLLHEGSPRLMVTATDALGYLGYMGFEPNIVIPELIPGLTNGNYGVRAHSAKALSQFGPKAATAVPALINALDDDDASARKAVEEALEKIAPEELDWDRETRVHKEPTVKHQFE